ncbi:tyrosine-type recombinase/integrase [Paenibacillus sp. WC2504]|uniref:tyrosine-type recombinase/integrase n=1 Tax=Paenibacillus sp. WC2504 TaxID=3461403 RepID=UPI0040456C28
MQNLVANSCLEKCQNVDDQFSIFLQQHQIPNYHRHQKNIIVFLMFRLSRREQIQLISKELDEDIHDYKKTLYTLVTIEKITLPKHRELLFSLSYFISFLIHYSGLSFQFTSPITQPYMPLFSDLGCSQFRDFINEEHKNNNLCIRHYIIEIKHFLLFIERGLVLNISNLKLEHVRAFEDHLLNRVLLEEIQQSTAYNRLRFLCVFLNYLQKVQCISFQYKIPAQFRFPKTRDNEYVSSKDREQLLHTIITNKAKNWARDLCIALSLIDLGCRPIEVSNLRINDVHLTEHKLTLYCKKSDMRTLRVSPFVIKHLSNFIKNERTLADTSDYIFMLSSGTRMTANCIGRVIRQYNHMAFNEIRFSAKALRHTYITDALENRNDFDQVSKSAGHKYWRSTMHYLHRSTKRLLTNTLPYNPMKRG